MEEEEVGPRVSERLQDISIKEWEEIHDIEKCNALTVTRLVQYMGLGYDAPYRVLKKKSYNAFVEGLLEYGRNMEEVAVKVIQLFQRTYKFEEYDIPGKNEIWLSMLGPNFLTHKYRRDLYPVSEEKDAGRPLYGSPDMIAINEKGEHHVIEIKCPRDSVCLVDITKKEQLEDLYEQKAYINSKDRRIRKKLMGHILQAAIYAWILSKSAGTKVAEECTLMYFYPDIASNTYLIIAYDIDWEVLLNPEEGGWDLEYILQEYYEKFIPLTKKGKVGFLRRLRSGIYPLFSNDDDDIPGVFSFLLSKGMLRTRMLIAGGESTKEITSYAMGRFLPVQTEQRSLEY